jgi:DegV family protein with EDD domain
MTVRIVTDSAADLPMEITNRYSIEVVPMIVYMEEKEYEDCVTLDPKTVYKSMRAGGIPKTAQIPAGKLQSVLEPHAASGEPTVYIGFSSELSGTYQTAVLVNEQLKDKYPEMQVAVLDSKCASLGMGLAVYLTAEYASQGHSYEEVLEAARFYCDHTEHLFTVDNLIYLARGGRCSRAAAFMGGLLDIKPLLDVEDGKLIPIEKLRGSKRLFKRMVELMGERGVDLANQVIAIGHGDDEDHAIELRDMIKDAYGFKDCIMRDIGGAIGAHAGPGTIALFFLNQLLE